MLRMRSRLICGRSSCPRYNRWVSFIRVPRPSVSMNLCPSHVPIVSNQKSPLAGTQDEYCIVEGSIGELAARIFFREPKKSRRDRGSWQVGHRLQFPGLHSDQVQIWTLRNYERSIEEFLRVMECSSSEAVLRYWRGLSHVCKSFIGQNNVPQVHIVWRSDSPIGTTDNISNRYSGCLPKIERDRGHGRHSSSNDRAIIRGH